MRSDQFSIALAQVHGVSYQDTFAPSPLSQCLVSTLGFRLGPHLGIMGMRMECLHRREAKEGRDGFVRLAESPLCTG